MSDILTLYAKGLGYRKIGRQLKLPRRKVLDFLGEMGVTRPAPDMEAKPKHDDVLVIELTGKKIVSRYKTQPPQWFSNIDFGGRR